MPFSIIIFNGLAPPYSSKSKNMPYGINYELIHYNWNTLVVKPARAVLFEISGSQPFDTRLSSKNPLAFPVIPQ